jgi:hypothetical protein
LDVDTIEAEKVLVDDAVDAAVACLAKLLRRVSTRGAVLENAVEEVGTKRRARSTVSFIDDLFGCCGRRSRLRGRHGSYVLATVVEV